MPDDNFKIGLAGIEALAVERASAEKEGRIMDHTVKKKAQDAKRKELRDEVNEKWAAEQKELELERKKEERKAKAAAKKEEALVIKK